MAQQDTPQLDSMDGARSPFTQFVLGVWVARTMGTLLLGT